MKEIVRCVAGVVLHLVRYFFLSNFFMVEFVFYPVGGAAGGPLDVRGVRVSLG